MFDLENFHSQLLWLNFRGYIWACCCPKCQDRGSGCVWEGFLSVETLLYRYRVILSALFKPYWKLHFKIIIIIQVLLIKRVLYSSCWTRPMGGFDCLCGLLLSSSLFSLWKNQKCSNIIGHAGSENPPASKFCQNRVLFLLWAGWAITHSLRQGHLQKEESKKVRCMTPYLAGCFWRRRNL